MNIKMWIWPKNNIRIENFHSYKIENYAKSECLDVVQEHSYVLYLSDTRINTISMCNIIIEFTGLCSVYMYRYYQLIEKAIEPGMVSQVETETVHGIFELVPRPLRQAVPSAKRRFLRVCLFVLTIFYFYINRKCIDSISISIR